MCYVIPLSKPEKETGRQNSQSGLLLQGAGGGLHLSNDFCCSIKFLALPKSVAMKMLRLLWIWPGQHFKTLAKLYS